MLVTNDEIKNESAWVINKITVGLLMQFTAYLIQLLKYNTNNTTYLKQQVA